MSICIYFYFYLKSQIEYTTNYTVWHALYKDEICAKNMSSKIYVLIELQYYSTASFYHKTAKGQKLKGHHQIA